MATPRIQSFRAFWPYYLAEHRQPRSRVLHFFGTVTWLVLFGIAAHSTWQTDPTRLAIGLGTFTAALVIGFLLEPRHNPVVFVAIAIGGVLYTDPLRFGIAIIGAYAFAWVGHFVIEKNRPATFSYPIWSLGGDHLMFFSMLVGRFWTGNDMGGVE